MTKHKVRNANLVVPDVGNVYTDNQFDARHLTVSEVVVGDPDGREVRGKLSDPAARMEDRDYACDLNVFNAVWVTLKAKDTNQPEGSQ